MILFALVSCLVFSMFYAQVRRLAGVDVLLLLFFAVAVCAWSNGRLTNRLFSDSAGLASKTPKSRSHNIPTHASLMLYFATMNSRNVTPKHAAQICNQNQAVLRIISSVYRKTKRLPVSWRTPKSWYSCKHSCSWSSKNPFAIIWSLTLDIGIPSTCISSSVSWISSAVFCTSV